MTDIIRMSPDEAKQRMFSGSALLVCAYDDEQKFARFHIEGAISLSELRSRLSSLSKETEIIFYCA